MSGWCAASLLPRVFAPLLLLLLLVVAEGFFDMMPTFVGASDRAGTGDREDLI
jgi:hypothetical protein